MNHNKPNFKQTEIGMIPEGWEVKKIGECCFLIKKSFQPSEFDIRPYIGLEHIDQYTLRLVSIGSSKDIESNKFEFKAGQILFGKLRPYFRKVIRPKFDGVCSTDIWVIDTKEGNDNSFFFYFIADQRIIDEANKSSEGTRMPRARWDYLEQLKFPIPPLPEQRAIAKILSDLDAKIELNQQMNKTLEEIGRAIFKRWFIDFEFPNEDGKPYKSSGGPMEYNEELGKEIPKGWRVGRLGEVVDVIKGCSYKKDDLKESQIAMITLKSINRGGGFNQEGYKEYTGDFKEEQVVKDGEIVVAQTDLTQKAEVIGRPAIVNSLGRYEKLIASLDLQIVRPKQKFFKHYLYYLLKTEEFHNHALSYTGGTTVLHLNKMAVPEFLALIPPENILEEFEKILNVIRHKISNNELQSHTLSSIRDALLPKLMSGKIRVPVSIAEDQSTEK